MTKATSMAACDVLVIGGGPAGAMAAGQAAARGLSVILLERNARIGKKLSITGKGRCNLTNNCEPDRLMNAIRRNQRFLFSAFNAFTPQDTMRFFEEYGMALKTERGNRVFPQSDNAWDVVSALERFLKDKGVRVVRGRASSVAKNGDGSFTTHTGDGKFFVSRCVVICTGGMSYPATGSTGDGYKIASSFGHVVQNLSPSLVASARSRSIISFNRSS